MGFLSILKEEHIAGWEWEIAPQETTSPQSLLKLGCQGYSTRGKGDSEIGGPPAEKWELQPASRKGKERGVIMKEKHCDWDVFQLSRLKYLWVYGWEEGKRSKKVWIWGWGRCNERYSGRVKTQSSVKSRSSDAFDIVSELRVNQGIIILWFEIKHLKEQLSSGCQI